MRPASPPDPSEFSGEDLEFYEKLTNTPTRKNPIPLDPNGPLVQYTQVVLNTPKATYFNQMFAYALRAAASRGDTYSHYDREWTEQVVCWDIDSHVSQEVHIVDALFHGVRPEAIKALAEGRDEDLTDDELLLATYTRQVCNGTVTDETYDAVEKRNGKRGAVELTLYLGSLLAAQRMLQALPGSKGPSREEVLSRVNEYVDGTRALPTEPIVPVPPAPDA